MDFIELRTTFTLVSFLVFLAIMWWAYSGKSSSNFAEASRIPFEEDDDALPAARAHSRGAVANERKE